MNILKLELTHFGKFHLKTITFTSGLNIVYGKNEAGKSTIHAFVRSMLFGIPDTPAAHSLRPAVGIKEPRSHKPGLWHIFMAGDKAKGA